LLVRELCCSVLTSIVFVRCSSLTSTPCKTFAFVTVFCAALTLCVLTTRNARVAQTSNIIDTLPKFVLPPRLEYVYTVYIYYSMVVSFIVETSDILYAFSAGAAGSEASAGLSALTASGATFDIDIAESTASAINFSTIPGSYVFVVKPRPSALR